MAAGAAYDLAFATAILGFPDAAASWMHLELPDDRVYFGLVGVLLILLAGLYGLAARQPRRYAGVIGVAAAGRLLGAAYLTAAGVAGSGSVFLALGAGDAAFAVWHALALAHALRADRASS